MKFHISIFLIAFFCGFSQGQTIISYSSSSVEYVDGLPAIFKFVQKNLVLPDSVKKGLTGGNVFVDLEIDSFGQIRKSEIIRSIRGCMQCDKEALRVVSLLPRPAFRPAIEMNARVPSKFPLRVSFKVNSDSLIPYYSLQIVGGWTFRDAMFKECNYCPVISFASDHSANLLSDKLSWKISKDILQITNLSTPDRPSDFLKDATYVISYEDYFRKLTLIGSQRTYYLIRK